MLRNLKQLKGPGIAAAGYLVVALSAALLVVSLKVGQLTGLPREVYWVPMLLGVTGALIGFLIGISGIIITWASFGNNNANLDRLASAASRLQWKGSTLFFKLGAGSAFVAAGLGGAAYLWMNIFLLLFGVALLATVLFVYLGAVSKLLRFMLSELD